MFKLYTSVGRWQLLDICSNEKEVVYSMIDYANKCHLYDYLIIERTDNTDLIHKRIRDEKGFKEYLLEVKERYTPTPIDDMSCVELKKYILNRRENKHGKNNKNI